MTPMSPRNLLLLFFSTMAASLVILIIVFSLFFKNMDLDFNARLPESAPDLGSLYGKREESLQSKAEGLLRATINVPPEVREFVDRLSPAQGASPDAEPSDSDLPPVSDDHVFFEDAPVPQEKAVSMPATDGRLENDPHVTTPPPAEDAIESPSENLAPPVPPAG